MVTSVNQSDAYVGDSHKPSLTTNALNNRTYCRWRNKLKLVTTETFPPPSTFCQRECIVSRTVTRLCDRSLLVGGLWVCSSLSLDLQWPDTEMSKVRRPMITHLFVFRDS